MANVLLRLALVTLIIIDYGSSQSDEFAETELPIGGDYAPVLLDSELPAPAPAEDTPPLNPNDPSEARVLPPIPFVNPDLFFNPFEAFNPVQSVVFDALANRFRADLEIANQRQNVMLKYVECSSPECKSVLVRGEMENPLRSIRGKGYWEWLQSVNPPAPGTVNCPPCPSQDAPKGYWEWLQTVNPTPPGSTPCSCPPPKEKREAAAKNADPLRFYPAPSYWDWLLGLNRPSSDVVRAEKFYAVMTALKDSIERLTVRQNILYEYVNCSCAVTNECGSALKPVLDLMFENNKNITKELIKDLVDERRSSFIDTLFNWIPNFNWSSFNPLSVLADLFKPTYSGGAGYSTSSGQGGAYTFSSSGKPGTEHYVIHHPGGGTSHVSTSTSPGATSVSVVSTDQKKETDEESADHVTAEDTSHKDKKGSPDSPAEEKKESHVKYVGDAFPDEHQATSYRLQEKSFPNSDKSPPVRGYWEWLQSVNPPAPGTVNCPPCPSQDAPKGYWEWLQTVNPTPPGSVPCSCPPPKEKAVDSDQPSQSSSEARQLFGGGPGVIIPAIANRVPGLYTGANAIGLGGIQPGIAAAGVGINQGLAAAQYTLG